MPNVSNSVPPPATRFIWLVAALGSIGPFAIDTYLPAMPAIGQDLGATPVQVQQTLSIYLLSFAAMSLWHGALSDALGRRRVLLAGFAVFGVASLGAAWAGSIESLWFWRAVQGMVGGAGMAISRAVIRDVADGAAAQRLMSQSTMVFALTPAIAPVIGGAIASSFGWRAVFLFLALMAFLLWLTVLWMLPETLPPQRRQSLHPVAMFKGYVSIFRQSAFWRLSGTLSLSFQGFFLYVMAAPAFLITHLKLAPTEFLWLFLPFTLGTAAGAFTNGKLAGRLSLDRCIRVGQVLMALALAANLGVSLWLPGQLPWAVLPLGLYTFGLAIAMANLQLMLMELSPQRRGMISSCQGFVQSVANALAAGLLVPLLWGSLMSLAIGSAMLMLAGSLLLAIDRRLRPAVADR